MKCRSDAIGIQFTLEINGQPIQSSVLVPLEQVIANPQILVKHAQREANQFWTGAVMLGLLDDRKGLK